MQRLPGVFDRLLPALLMASSVTLLGAGLLSYAPAVEDAVKTPDPIQVGGDPLFTPLPRPSATQAPAATASPLPLNPIHPPEPTAAPSSGGDGVASRIRIPSLQIDLPVVSGHLVVPGNVDLYPLCDVAMFLPDYIQPGQDGATYIYAHAQKGMFWPLLKQSQINDGAALIGSLIEVYTTDDMLHLYEIYTVKRHATDLSLAEAPPGAHLLVLQTSEGVSGTVPKLQVAARPLSAVPADAGEANPPPRPRVCLPS